LPEPIFTFGMRLLFAALSLPVWLALVLLARATGRAAAIWLVMAALVSPLAILTSTQVQLDGSIGVLLTGPVVILLLAVALGRTLACWQTPLLLLAGACVGLGKQEWSLALLGALIFWQLAHGWRRREARWRGGALLLLGLALGNALSFAFDPHNYLGGFRMMDRVIHAGMLAPGAEPFHWLGGAVARLPMLVPLPLLVAAGWLWHRTALVPDQPAARHILAYFAGLLFLGFFASSWGSDPRYFAPALLAATAAALAQLDRVPSPQTQRSVGLIIPLLLVLHTAVFFSWRALYPCTYRYPPIPAATQVGQCLPLLSSAQAWNRLDVDFISDALDWNSASWLAKSKGRTLCAADPPPQCTWAQRIIRP
jgi:hypothetical protein